jgi:hypothetical protein
VGTLSEIGRSQHREDMSSLPRFEIEDDAWARTSIRR